MESVRRAVKQIAHTPPSQWLSTLSLNHLSVTPFLFLASSLYSVAIRLRRQLHRLNILAEHRLPVPVISVGNLTWGGNGKTPMVEFLARSFSDAGISPLILTRGYRGGDEVKMLERQLKGTSSKVGVGANRVATAKQFLERDGFINFHDAYEKPFSNRSMKIQSNSNRVGVAILDDGMQYLSLWRGVEIVMVNALMPWGNNRLIPLGALREPLTALRRADILVIHHVDLVPEKAVETLESTIEKVKGLPIFFTKMVPVHFFPFPDITCIIPLKAIENMTVLCLSGIGFADSFVQIIRGMRPAYVDHVDFSDHHLFHLKDIEMVQARLEALETEFASKPVVIVTEKDHDRDPKVFQHLNHYEVLVLHSRLEFVARKGSTKEGFENMVREHLLRRFDA